ncbi:malto-oligosyltrehalose synthase [Streptomyces sp. TS71-3]|uniref:malto-oligosyltrehalose synthase n=1 Tax=Streptomyces sp. TS71-3 TaxID=2733862 RepID=UPI001BB3D7AB|nr:malto-oligosyltrehalose synthase [Streptomyces sp. TS71-3]
MTPVSAGPEVRVPTATYRLQLQPAFPFAAAAGAVPYLAGLGVSHLHLSPVLEAVPGSAHGYDVVDHARVRGELGGEEGLRALSRTARAHGLGLVVDIVPNHMAAVPRYNRALWEVLRQGPDCPYGRWFDIDWEAGGGQVLLPVLAGPLGGELDELRLTGAGRAGPYAAAAGTAGGEPAADMAGGRRAGAGRAFDGAADGGPCLRYGEQVLPLREGTERLPLPRLLDAQWYRLCWWRLARTELNYRRFFTVSELIGVRVEDPEVFRLTHAKVLGLLDEGVLDGLRVDHPDGLADPGGYLRRLHKACGGRWTVVEKILADGERLPAAWPVAGTTGYDALRQVDGVLTDPEGALELLALYRARVAAPADRGGEWAATVRRAARQVVAEELAAEVERLTRACARVCAADPGLRDHAPWALRTALRELLVRLPVYRPYDDTDAGWVLSREAAEDAKGAFAVPEEAAAVDVVRDLVLGRLGTGRDGEEFRARFAQTASALRAKAVEDTAFYRYGPLLSAAEVGGDPGLPALPPAAFHAHCARVQRAWPLTGTVLSTHDTKRSADARARIALLTECPERFAALLDEANALTAADGASVPGAGLAWAAWQTAVALADPRGPETARIRAALLKHVREAGLDTTWTEPDETYEKAVAGFAAAGPGGAPAHRLVTRFAATLAPHVRARVLGAALLHLTMPGVPDLYQGTEHDYRALVDPDNRVPARLPGTFGGDGREPRRTGGTTGTTSPVPASLSAEKAALTAAALRLRARRPAVFGEAASYRPLEAAGPAAAHCLAFLRTGAVLTAVTRLSLRLAEAGGWRGTRLTLPEGHWHDLLAIGHEFTGSILLEDLFRGAPVALLERVEGASGGVLGDP